MSQFAIMSSMAGVWSWSSGHHNKSKHNSLTTNSNTNTNRKQNNGKTPLASRKPAKHRNNSRRSNSTTPQAAVSHARITQHMHPKMPRHASPAGVDVLHSLRRRCPFLRFTSHLTVPDNDRLLGCLTGDMVRGPCSMPVRFGRMLRSLLL